MDRSRQEEQGHTTVTSCDPQGFLRRRNKVLCAGIAQHHTP
jgi:hypothetical protein